MADKMTLVCKVDDEAFNNKGAPFTVESSLTVRGFYIAVSAGATIDVNIPMMFIKGSTRPSTYSPYSNICPISGRTSATIYHSGADTSDPTTYTIQLGDTVYGGMLDVTAGKLNVTMAMVDVTTGSDNGIIHGSQQLAYSFPGKKPGLDNFISNVFSVGSDAYQMTGRVSTAIVEFRVPLDALGVTAEDSSTVRVNAFKAWLTDHSTQLCYELATPIEITLTPTQIEMLLGENNLWSDAGDSTLTYYADGNASEIEALNILLGNRYYNNHEADEPTDREALNILLGGNR